MIERHQTPFLLDFFRNTVWLIKLPILVLLLLTSFSFVRGNEKEDIQALNIEVNSDHQIGITNGGMCYDESVYLFYPETTQDVVAIVELARKHSRVVRVVGSMHSLNPICYSPGYMVSLNKMNRVLAIDKDECTIEGGIIIRDLCLALEKEGLSLAVLGSITEQSFAGAIATGTRGQIPAEGSLASLVTSIELVDGSGNIRYLSKENPQFYAVVTSLGVYGIVTKLTVKCTPLFLMTELIRRMPLEGVMDQLDTLKQSNKLVFFWNVAGDEVKVITGHRISCEISPKELASFEMLGCYPHLHTMEDFDDTIQRTGKSWELITLLTWTAEKNARRAKLMREQNFGIFQGDYAVSQTELKPLLEDVKDYFRTHSPKLSKERMVVEIRPVREDDIWLSPSYKRDSFSLCFHDFDRPLEWSTEAAKEFIEFENYLKSRYDIRPHFGKAHFFTDQELQDAFPKWNEFKQLREEFDPQGIFLNDYLRSMLTNF